MFTFVTIIYDDYYDNELFLLQTKTMNNIDNNIISKIIIIFNTENDESYDNYKKKFYDEIIFNYPDNIQSKVLLIYKKELYIVCGLNNCYSLPKSINPQHTLNDNYGWHIQQILKIIVSKIIDTEHYIVLDSKDHFINFTDYSCFFENDTPIFFQKENIETCNSVKQSIISSFMYFHNTIKKINDSQVICDFDGNEYLTIKPITPFVFKTKYVIELIQYISGSFNISFDLLFLLKDFNEFQLYYSYLIYSKKSSEYKIVDVPEFKFWKNSSIPIFFNNDLIDNGKNKIIKCIGVYKDIRFLFVNEGDDIIVFNFYKNFLNDDQIIHIKNLFLHQ